MKTFILGLCLVLTGIVLPSFTLTKKGKITKSDFAGFWVTTNPADNSFSHMKVFNKDGSYHNVSMENGEMIITHQGKFNILNENKYKEKVTNLRFNAKWDLKNREFVNYYELNKDKTLLILSGTVYSKDGTDSLKWSHKYKRVQLPE